MDIKAAIKTVTEQRDLTQDEMAAVMHLIMTGQVTPAQIGGFLIGLRMKGETVDEITAAAQIMRELATPVTVTGNYLVDIVGTGGDGTGTFNISTTSTFVIAAAGGTVAKHGNRSISSKSGSADVLEALGVKINLTSEQITQCVNEVGVGFMFAPLHHSAMKHAIGPRREMGVRTIFNLLGPLTNPANVPNLLIGVFDQPWVEPIAKVAQKLGLQHVLVVHSEDGLDEISIAAPTFMAELQQGKVTTQTITPETFGLKRANLEQICVNSIEESVTIVRSVLENQATPARDVVILNAGMAIYTAGLTENVAEGIQHAQEVIASGAALERLNALVTLTQNFAT